VAELDHEPRPSPLASALVRDRHPARAKPERGEPVRLLEPTGPQGLERGHQHLLDEVLGGHTVTEPAGEWPAIAREHLGGSTR
jgi:hypothetical protein